MTQDNHDHMIRTSAGYVPGLIVAGLGVLFLLSNLEIVRIYSWWQLWPVVLIGIGATKLVDEPAHHQKASGAIMIVAGGLFLASTFGWLPWNVWDFWPVAIIGAGVVMLIQRLGQIDERSHWNVPPPDTRTGGLAIFSGFDRRISGEYRGAEYVAVFGGGKVNLRRAEIAADAVVIHVTAIFGGLEFEVPDHWQVVNDVVGIFGATDDRTAQPSPETPGLKRLIVRGAAIFGGVSIKN
jgi:LiaF transmembrane domain